MIHNLGLEDPMLLKIAVNDNASNAKCAIKMCDDLVQHLCSNHTLQLSVSDTFGSTNHAGARMSEVLKKSKILAKFTNKSLPAKEALKSTCKQLNVAFTTLKNPNETRWNSQFSNLQSLVKLKNPLLKLSSEDMGGTWSVKMLTAAQWKLAEAAVEILKFPMLVTKAWEAEKTPTMNLVMEQLYTLRSNLEEFIEESHNCRWVAFLTIAISPVLFMIVCILCFHLLSTACIKLVSFSFARKFAQDLLYNVDGRMPNCCADSNLVCYGNYLDPSFKGVHLESLGVMEDTKKMMIARWGGQVGDEGATLSEDLTGLTPTERLVRRRSRQVSGSILNKTKFEMEMMQYESLDMLENDGDRLAWWANHEGILPLLSHAAKEILGIPCSSSKSERVFSTSGQVR